MSSGSSKPRIRDRFKRFLNRKGKQGSPSTQPLSQSSSSTLSQSNVSVVPNVVRSNSTTNVPSILDSSVPARSETAIQSPSNDSPTAAMTPASSNDVVSSNLPTLSNSFALVLPPSAAAPSSVRTHSWTEPLRAPAGTGWKILKDTLNVVIQISGPVPPLQLAVSGVLSAMNLIDMAIGKDNKHEEFVVIAGKIQAFANTIQRYQDISGKRSAVFQDRVNGIVQAMSLLKHSIQEKIDRGIVKRVLSSSSDAQVVADAFTSLTSLIELFSLEQMFEIESNTELIRAGIDDLKYEANLNSLASVTTASYRNQKDKPTCLEGTRVTILDDLLSWALDPNSPRVYWLNGIAGTGKSTITRSLCGLFRSTDLFGAAFFCSRDSANQSNVLRIIPSLAHFLAREHIAYGSELHAILTDDKELAQLEVLDEQLEKLLILPSERAFSTRRHAPIIIIDALDECSDGKAIAKFLRLVLLNEIEMRFSLPDSKNHSVFHLHNVEDFFIRADIAFYLEKELENIRTDKALASNWATTHDIAVLTDLSDKLFIYASTVLKYISEYPESRLDRLVTPHARAGIPLTKELDSIYRLILRDAVDPRHREEEEITDTTRVLAAIITVQELLPLNVLGKLLVIGTRRIQDALKDLHALILIRDDGYVSTFHASLADYLTDPHRSGHERWFVDQHLAHYNMTHDCLYIAQSELKFNLSGIQSSYERNSAHKYIHSLSAQVSYASRFWVDHVVSTSESQRTTVLDQITKFLHTKFLFWIEALSILGMGYQASSMIRSLSVSLEKVPEATASILVILQDCNDFLVAFREPISTSTPHIYLSALAFVPPTSLVSQRYWSWFPRIPQVLLAGSAHLNTVPVLKLEGHTNWVTSVAFSSDGKRIVSGSGDRTIRVWDAETGKEALSPLEGHTDWVRSVAFSNDGKRIVSGSDDHTIRVWDAETGKEAMSPLESHMGWIASNDGKLITSDPSNHTAGVENVLRDQVNMLAAFSSDPRHSFSAEFLRARTENGDLRDAFCLKDGWIVGPSDELILWIPLEYHTALWRPRMTLMIAQSRVELDLSKFEHGSRWTNCYNPGEPLT